MFSVEVLGCLQVPGPVQSVQFGFDGEETYCNWTLCTLAKGPVKTAGVSSDSQLKINLFIPQNWFWDRQDVLRWATVFLAQVSYSRPTVSRVPRLAAGSLTWLTSDPDPSSLTWLWASSCCYSSVMTVGLLGHGWIYLLPLINACISMLSARLNTGKLKFQK